MSTVPLIKQKVEFKQPKSWHGREVRVVVIGAGGNGSEVIDSLAAFHHAMICLGRSGGLHVTVIDDSKVREPNLVRQRFWPCDLGQYKSVVLANRYNLQLGLSWEGLPCRFPSVETEAAMSKADIVISAVDLPSARVAIADYEGRVKRDAMWLDLGNGHRHGQAVFGALAPAMRAEYPCVLDVYPEVRHMQDDTRKSCSTAEALASQDCLVNRTITTAGLSALWEVLRYGATDKHWIVIDLKTGMQSAHSFPPI